MQVSRIRAVGVLSAVLVGLLTSPAFGQGPGGVEVAVPAPSPAWPDIAVEPTAPPEQRGVREQEFYSGEVKSGHDPAYVKPFVATVPVSRTSAIRLGLSGWTAPAAPVGIKEIGSGVAFGLTLQWGLPAPPGMASPPQSSPR